MRIAIITETDPVETRVAASAETVKKLVALGATIAVQSGAGTQSGMTDDDFAAAGATIAKTAKDTLKDAEIVLKVRRPSSAEIKLIKKGALVLAIMDPYDSAEGAGVAGLQAIATARRLGAVVTATDVRPAAKEQVASLGAKFVAVEDEEFKQAETATGYAKPMSAEYQAKQSELVAAHIAKQDIVITTALIPGRPAPKLVSEAMVKSMRAGSVIVDLAVERGGNVALAKAGETVMTANGVKIIGHLNVPGRVPASASALYAKNLFSFLETMIDKTTKALAINWEDELVKATNLTRDGAIVHPAFQPKA